LSSRSLSGLPEIVFDFFRIFMTNMDLGSALSLAIAVPGINLLVVTHNYEEGSE